MTLSAIHNSRRHCSVSRQVVCDIGGYDFVSYSQHYTLPYYCIIVVCDIGGYDFVSYSQRIEPVTKGDRCCL